MELKKDGDQYLHIVDASIAKVYQDAMRSTLSKESEYIVISAGGVTSNIHVKVNSYGQF
ncbi:MAG: hypothetical protein P857_646 [Candidatus Xenolissoclinum pacificiensis L6]|uniref:Uncharacterized protein n=1 Tax=Candidatus Xenolissoclinum pacificiensis L6 TaxID=1401685 RepID=W2V133_9RICK|nr:MAG: hypothetical protein P857_646 [Candidatus Xenolissoclinum pacificiensis L6]